MLIRKTKDDNIRALLDLEDVECCTSMSIFGMWTFDDVSVALWTGSASTAAVGSSPRRRWRATATSTTCSDPSCATAAAPTNATNTCSVTCSCGTAPWCATATSTARPCPRRSRFDSAADLAPGDRLLVLLTWHDAFLRVHVLMLCTLCFSRFSDVEWSVSEKFNCLTVKASTTH